jgi:predicted  nucleic acid-binding Zn-ribbon protein
MDMIKQENDALRKRLSNTKAAVATLQGKVDLQKEKLTEKDETIRNLEQEMAVGAELAIKDDHGHYTNMKRCVRWVRNWP